MYTLEKLFLEFVQTSLTATIIISAYILLMKIFNRNIKERMKYILMILIVIRLLIPVTVNIDFSNVISNLSTNNISSGDNNLSDINKVDRNYKVNTRLGKETDISESKNNIEIQNKNRDLFQSLVYKGCLIWISGIIILFSIIFFSSFRFKFKLKKSMLSNSKKLELLLSNIKNKLNIKRNIPIFICENIESPCIVGILNTTIYVPKFIFKFSNSDVKYMLTHELIHYKRKDLYFNLLTISALLIHWFNPLVWILVNKIKNCREYACDAGVLEFLGEEENVDYKTDLNRNEELSTEIGIMSIYDRDDLKKAEGFLGFNPKMPLNLNNNVVVDGSGVGLTGDSDVENNKINYELNLLYNHGDKRITFNQSNHDSFNFYKRIKENGYVDRSNDDWATNKKINMDKLDVDGKIVYKYMESFKDPEEDQSEASTHVYYKWEENGVYCSLVFVDTDQYQDEIAKEFVNSKTIE